MPSSIIWLTRYMALYFILTSTKIAFINMYNLIVSNWESIKILVYYQFLRPMGYKHEALGLNGGRLKPTTEPKQDKNE
jgi:hypothetical protein